MHTALFSVIDPSVTISILRESRFVRAPTRVGSTKYLTFLTGENPTNHF